MTNSIRICFATASLAAVCLFLLSSGTTRAQNGGPVFAADAPTSGIQLANGTILDAKVKRIDDHWVEAELGSGGLIQLPWSDLRADRFLEQRRALVIHTSSTSVRRFAEWCREAGLAEEGRRADVEFSNLVGGGKPPEVSKPNQPEVDKPSKSDDAGPTGKRADEPKAPGGYTGPKAKSINVVVTDEKAVETVALDAVKAKIAATGIKMAVPKPEMKLEITSLVVVTKKHVKWMSATVYAICAGKASITVTYPDGKTEVKTFETSDVRSNKQLDDAQKSARGDLVSAIYNWLDDRIEPAK